MLRDVRAGELVPASAVGDADAVDVQRVTVRADAMSTTGLARGSRVDVFVTPKASTGATPSTTTPRTKKVLESAAVAAVLTSTGGFGSGSMTSVQIYVPSDKVQPLVEAVDGEAKLTLVPSVGPLPAAEHDRGPDRPQPPVGVGGGHDARGVRGVTVSRRCADVSELLSVAEAGLGDTAVVSSDLRGLDLAVVNRLRANRIRVIGVHPADDEAAERRLRQLTVTTTLPVDADADRWTTPSCRATAPSTSSRPPLQASGPPAPRSRRGRPTSARAPSGTGRDRGPPASDTRITRATARRLCRSGTGGSRQARMADRPAPSRDRRCGPARSGSPAPRPHRRLPSRPGPRPRRRGLGAHRRPRTDDGRDDAGRRDRPAGIEVLLVDADTYGGCVAQTLGLLDEAPGIAAACRAADQGTARPARPLAHRARVVPGLRVLTGLPKAERWPEVRAAALERVLELSRSLVQVVVVDCGFCLEDDEELSYDTVAPRRNEATLTSLAASDLVVAVGGADPVALQRFVRGLQELGTVPSAEPVPVVNRVRSAAVGSRPEARIADSLLRFAGLTSVRFVPDDPAALDGALLAGRSLVEHAPDSPVRDAVADLATALLPWTVPAGPAP